VTDADQPDPPAADSQDCYTVDEMLVDAGDAHAEKPFDGGCFIGYDQKAGARFWFSSLTDEQVCYLKAAFDSMVDDMFRAAKTSLDSRH